MQLYLIRHGETASNHTGMHGKRTDRLSELGREQAEFVTQRFLKIPIEQCKRSKQTARRPVTPARRLERPRDRVVGAR